MTIIATHTVPPDVNPCRLSDYVHLAFHEIPTRKSGKKTIKRGEIVVDGQVGVTGLWVKPGMQLQWQRQEPKIFKPYQKKIPVIYEDEHLAIVNKPPGIATNGNQFKTLENIAAYNLAKSTLKSAYNIPKAAHRLDKATSGLVILAKSMQAHVNIGQAFSQNCIEKSYRAIVIGRPPRTDAIDMNIKGKHARTIFKRIATYPSLKCGYISMLNLHPQTGRTHQLRIHLSAIGHPVLGDKLYGQKGLILRNKGLFLCATGISFEHPISGKILDVHISPPLKFFTHTKREVRRWRKYHP